MDNIKDIFQKLYAEKQKEDASKLPLTSGYIQWYPASTPCPSCGHCPHCGRGRTTYPVNPWYSPWSTTVTCVGK